MTDLAHAHEVIAAGEWTGPAADRVRLDYEARFLRRKRLEAEGGTVFLADLPQTVSLGPGDALRLSDGRLVEVLAAQEPLLQITGADLVRLAWHIGNRHTPCQIEAGRLLIARDPVLADMLRHLGATLAEVVEPFRPEGGAYGHGRTMGHDHGHDHDHGAGHRHRHVHTHVRSDSDRPDEDDGPEAASNA